MTSTTCCTEGSGGGLKGYPLKIRAANRADITRLTEILAESFHTREGLSGLMYPIFRLGIYEDLRNRLATSSGYYTCLVAAIADSPHQLGNIPLNVPEHLVGTVEMGLRTPSPWSIGDRYPYISNLAVHPTARRQGVARKLLISCEQVAMKWGFSDLYLHVLENNSQARQLYHQVGYRIAQIDWSWDSVFLGQPRRLFLCKNLSHS